MMIILDYPMLHLWKIIKKGLERIKEIVEKFKSKLNSPKYKGGGGFHNIIM